MSSGRSPPRVGKRWGPLSASWPQWQFSRAWWRSVDHLMTPAMRVWTEHPAPLVIGNTIDLSIIGPWMGHRALERNGVSSQEEGQLRGFGTASAHSCVNQSCHSPNLYSFIHVMCKKSSQLTLRLSSLTHGLETQKLDLILLIRIKIECQSCLCFNSSPPGAENMRQWIRSALVQIMAWPCHRRAFI